MADRERFWADFGREASRLGSDLRETLSLRWQLAVLELRADLRSAKRLATAMSLAIVAGLTGLPLLAVCAADVLDLRLGIPRIGWLLIFGVVLLGGAAVAGWLAWRRFRKGLVGLDETLEELREDVVWLRQWMGRDEPDAGENVHA